MHEQFQFDRERFKDVVHLIVDHALKAHGEDAIGNTKLHKAAYYADMLHYVDTGRPLTGADYQRQKFGPTARHLSWALEELARERRLSVSKVNYFGFPKCRYQSLAEPRTNRLSDEQIRLIIHISDFVCAQTAVEISEFSHDEVWSSVPMGKRIPYFAAFAMFPAEVTEEDIRDAESEAMAIAPEIEAERRERNSV